MQAVLFSAALTLLGTAPAPASAPAAVAGTYAAVTPQNVEFLTLTSSGGTVHGTYRILHLDGSVRDGLIDESTPLAAAGPTSFALAQGRALTLHFDRGFQNAVVQSPGLPENTQAFRRVTPEQVSLLMEMAHYGGLYVLCQSHDTQADPFCQSMAPRLASIVPFRPFPHASAKNPVLGYEVRAQLARTVAVRTP